MGYAPYRYNFMNELHPLLQIFHKSRLLLDFDGVVSPKPFEHQQIDNMTAFIADHFNISIEEAKDKAAGFFNRSNRSGTLVGFYKTLLDSYAQDDSPSYSKLPKEDNPDLVLQKMIAYCYDLDRVTQAKDNPTVQEQLKHSRIFLNYLRHFDKPSAVLSTSPFSFLKNAMDYYIPDRGNFLTDSHLIGVDNLTFEAKPRQYAFDYALQVLNWKPEDVLFIDDSWQNIQVANKLGFNTVYVDHDTKGLSQDNGQWTISSLSDLNELLAAEQEAILVNCQSVLTSSYS